MNILSRTARLISAAIAATTMLVIFSSIVSIAEPQRSELMAKSQRLENVPSTTTTLALASNVSDKSGK